MANPQQVGFPGKLDSSGHPVGLMIESDSIIVDPNYQPCDGRRIPVGTFPLLEPYLANDVTSIFRGGAIVGGFAALASSGTAVVSTSAGGSGTTDRLARTTDGVSWSARTTASAAFDRLIYGDRFLSAVSGSTTAATSTDDGLTWTAQTLPGALPVTGDAFQPFAWTGTHFVMLPGSGNVYRSTTAATGSWAAASLPASIEGRAIVHVGNGKLILFYLGAGAYLRMYVSTDHGATWSDGGRMPLLIAVPSSGGSTIDAVSNGAGTIAVMMFSSNTSYVLLSTDSGVNWKAANVQPFPINSTNAGRTAVASLAFAGGKILAYQRNAADYAVFELIGDTFVPLHGSGGLTASTIVRAISALSNGVFIGGDGSNTYGYSTWTYNSGYKRMPLWSWKDYNDSSMRRWIKVR